MLNNTLEKLMNSKSSYTSSKVNDYRIEHFIDHNGHNVLIYHFEKLVAKWVESKVHLFVRQDYAHMKEEISETLTKCGYFNRIILDHYV